MAKKKAHSIRIYNCSQQMIPIHVRAPGGDFYSSEQQIRVAPGNDVLLLKKHTMEDQIRNLQAKRMIRVTYDSETMAE